MIGQFSRDGIGCKTHVNFVSSHWSIVKLVYMEPSIVTQIKLVCLRSICRFCLYPGQVMNKSTFSVDPWQHVSTNYHIDDIGLNYI